MPSLEQLQQLAAAKRQECLALSRAYHASLSALSPANILLVVGAALLSFTAGTAILMDGGFITKTQAGLLAFLSGALTVIHSKLGCEPYQAESRKLSSFYRGMAEDYDNLNTAGDADELRTRLTTLNDQMAAAIKSATSLPFRWASKRAKSVIS